MKKTNRKNTIKSIMLALVLIVVCLFFISSTYARYVSTANGTGTVSIANWAVAVNDTNISNASTDFTLTFTANNANTVANKVAPGGTATAYVDVNLTGTEVSVDFNAALAGTAATNLAAVFGASYADKVTLVTGTPTLLDGATNMTLSGTTVTVGSGAMSGTVRVPVTLTWTDAAANNAADTNTGVTQTTLTVPVTLNVQQHI